MDFCEILTGLLNKKGITAYKVAKDLGINQGTMGRYVNGENIPESKNLKKIADYFNVSTDYLLGKDTSPKEITDSDLKYALFGDPEFDDEVLDDIKAAAKAIADRKKQKTGK